MQLTSLALFLRIVAINIRGLSIRIDDYVDVVVFRDIDPTWDSTLHLNEQGIVTIVRDPANCLIQLIS